MKLVLLFDAATRLTFTGLGCWGHKYSIAKVVDGVYTELAHSGVASEVQVGRWYTVTAVVVGGNLEMIVDGVKILQVQDASHPTGAVGFRTFSSTMQVEQIIVQSLGIAPDIETLYFNVFFEDDVYVIETYSNSVVSNLSFNQTLKQLSLRVDGTAETSGFCKIAFPEELMSGEFAIYMDKLPLFEGTDYDESINGTHYLFSISYEHSSHVIDIYSTVAVPDFAGWLFLPFLIFATLLAFTFRKRLKRRHYQKP